MRYIILGTAGHIDHGKSSLVKALTGIDPDRLKEEKLRGITIDLGFADLRFDDLTVGIIDVPGHERLIKNMLAGTGSVDIVLLVIAADEGVMPQTIEHLAICNMLGCKSGIVALTKCDLVDKEFLQLVHDEVSDFIKGTFLDDFNTIIPVSAKTGENIELIKLKIQELSKKIKPKSSGGLFRLPIDRVFTLKGFGTIVTGTVLSGEIKVDDMVEILPKGITCKVRGLQSHGSFMQNAGAGQRVALNLQGVDKDDILRGDVVSVANVFKVTDKIDTHITLLKNSPTLKNRGTIHLHIGSSEVIARVILYDKPLLNSEESAFCQLRLSSPIVALSGERFIMRRISPLQTIGGGVVLDPFPIRRKKSKGLDDLNIYLKGELHSLLHEKIKTYGLIGMDIDEIKIFINQDIKAIDNAIEKLIKNGLILMIDTKIFDKVILSTLYKDIESKLKEFHKKYPLKEGIPKEALKSLFQNVEREIFFKILSLNKEILIEKESVRLAGARGIVSVQDQEKTAKTLELLKKAGFNPPTKKEIADLIALKENQVWDILKFLASQGSVVRINDSIYLDKGGFDEMMVKIKEFSKGKKDISVAEFRDLIGTTRKYALPFLEYLDTNKITLRIGDGRKILI
ncbi:MAG: selenocysteine-specific translation elongation factor [Nitrospirae bacterium]|nr:selenocysteine-specific translation elongation factor [Nitrospirota bacterium]MBF0540265.1 selenocysteine-specific translation elongation factor [Nitrospirota bacterium]